LPAQFVVRAETIPLAAKGDPGTAERDPLCEIWNAATSCWLSTPANRNWPFALTFNPAIDQSHFAHFHPLQKEIRQFV
jgi:hypothetical protein